MVFIFPLSHIKEYLGVVLFFFLFYMLHSRYMHVWAVSLLCASVPQ